MKLKTLFDNFDWHLPVLVVVLVVFGVLMVFDSSSVSAVTEFGNKYFYVKEQLKGVVLGFLGLIFAAFFDYRRYYKLSLPFLLLCLLLLVAVFIPGFGVHALGANRWLNFGFFILQPSELTKLAMTMYLAAWLSQKEKSRLMAFLLLIGLVVGLIVLEPDLGTAIVLISTSILIYFVSGAPLKHFLALVPIVVTGIVGLAVTSPYRFQRVMTFLNPSNDPLGASYHVRQILISLGSGGIWGLGLGKSRQKFSYLPEASTDSIFAIIAEELGFIGSVCLILLFVYLIYRGFLIAKAAPDNFGRLLSFGIISWFSLQIIVNLSSMVALSPLTGIPLPFISYGSSSLAVELLAVGILINVQRQESKKLRY